MIEKPENRRTVARDIHEHEVFLSFNSDWHAVAFQDWLENEGYERFTKWAEKRREDYR